jgi:hypothetical protein
MRRIQFYLDEDLDDTLEAEAARIGTSKAALIRESVAARFRRTGRHDDPMEAMLGAFAGEAGDDIDDVVYGT